MVNEVALKVRKDGHKKIGVLSSIMSRSLYAKHFEANELNLVLPKTNVQKDIERIIAAVLGGIKNGKITRELNDHADQLIAMGAECVVLGCTDLPLILKSEQVKYPLYSSTAILADAMVREAKE